MTNEINIATVQEVVKSPVQRAYEAGFTAGASEGYLDGIMQGVLYGSIGMGMLVGFAWWAFDQGMVG